MNRQQYIYELRRELERMPFQEREDAVHYYEEYFDDAGVENEQKVIDEIGSPQEVAKQILKDFTIKDLNTPVQTPKQGFVKIWQVVLLILASPIAFPLAIAVVAVVFSVVIALVAVIFAFAAAGLALFLAGIAAIIAGFSVISSGIATTLFFIGIGMVLIGVGFVIGYASVFIGAKITTAIVRSLGRLLKRVTSKKEGKTI